MKKASLSLALCAALSVVMAAAPADAQTKKKAASKPAQVTVSKAPHAHYVGHFHSCGGAGHQAFGRVPLLNLILVPITTVGCGLVFAVPILVETFVVRHHDHG
jgi:hypothetical protein